MWTADYNVFPPPAVTFPALYTATKLRRLIRDRGVNNLPKVVTRQRRGLKWNSRDSRAPVGCHNHCTNTAACETIRWLAGLRINCSAAEVETAQYIKCRRSTSASDVCDVTVGLRQL